VRLLYKTSIDCGHRIEDSPDLVTKKCANEHGHTYNFEFDFDGEFLKSFFKKEKFLDFAFVKELVEDELKKYDHKNITKEFEIHTVEELAQKVKDNILKEVAGGTTVCWVTVFETAKYGVKC
jgi:6-pyruvoyl-tetrahydropterin synthase